MKTLARNSMYNVIYKCLGVIFPLVTSVYVSRILMAEGVGKVAAAQNISSYFVIIATLGLPTYGVKKIAECVKQEQVDKCFSELYSINFISTIICSLIYYLIIFNVGIFGTRHLLLSITGLSIVLNIFNVDWFYQGKEEFKYIMLRSFFVKIVSLILIFCFVKNSNDYIFYALIQTSGTAFNYLFNIYNARKYVNFRIRKLNLFQHLSPLIFMLASTIAIEIYTLADTTMLSVMCSDSIVGYYSTAVKAINIVKMLVSSVCAVFLPRMAMYYSNSNNEQFTKLINKGIQIIFGLSCPAIILLTGLGGELIQLLFGSGYIESVVTLQILSFSVLTVSLSGFIGSQVLITLGKEKIVFYSTFFGAIVNVSLNAILIKYFEHNGAAVASVMAELAVTFVQYLYFRHFMQRRINNKSYYKVLSVQSMVMVVIIVIGKLIINNYLLRLFLSGICASTAYVFLGIYLKNEFIYSVLNKIPFINLNRG